MPLVFSPLSESVLDAPPKALLPRHAFVMRQIGSPSAVDVAIHTQLKKTFERRKITAIDADTTTGGKDFLQRILDLIRSTGFTVAIFTHQTRQISLANIALELRFAAMCGKPLVILKSKEASAPSDLTRTDWIDYDADDLLGFERKLDQAIDELDRLGEHESTLLQVTMAASSPDCAVALERCNKGFLLSGDKTFIVSAQKILNRLNKVLERGAIADLERQRQEVRTFIRQARRAIRETSQSSAI